YSKLAKRSLQMLMSRSRAILASLIIALSAPHGLAQSTFGAIVGTVHDATGATVADAVVRLQNMNENTTREATTSADGAYQVLNLKPATYKITVTHAGFQPVTVSDVQLVARQTVRVD